MNTMAHAFQPAADSFDWHALVDRIQRGDPDGLGEFYALLERGVRLMLARQMCRYDIDDKLHDTFLILVQAIRRGELREPDRLMGFVRTVVRRQMAGHIERSVRARREESSEEAAEMVTTDAAGPEDAAIARETNEMVESVLRSIPPRDREILTRFYLHEQTQEEICREMDLSETQFRLLKSRAKARFGALGKRRTNGRKLSLRGMSASAH